MAQQGLFLRGVYMSAIERKFKRKPNDEGEIKEGSEYLLKLNTGEDTHEVSFREDDWDDLKKLCVGKRKGVDVLEVQVRAFARPGWNNAPPRVVLQGGAGTSRGEEIDFGMVAS